MIIRYMIVLSFVFHTNAAFACKKKPAEGAAAEGGAAENAMAQAEKNSKANLNGDGKGSERGALDGRSAAYAACVTASCPNNSSPCQAQCAAGDTGPRWDIPNDPQGGNGYIMVQ